MKKTLGGDRLGSGKKMTVDLHEYGRSTHDLGYICRTTMSAGTLVPFLSIVGLPGDTFDINLDVDIKTHPTIGPLFASGKVQLDIFEAPIRLYNAMLHNNKVGIGMDMSKVKFPLLEIEGRGVPSDITVDMDNAQINPSCILSYLGIRGSGFIEPLEIPLKVRQFNGIPLLAYWEIFKNYYANKQETNAYVIHGPQTPTSEIVDEITIDGNTLEQYPTQSGFILGPVTGQTTLIITTTGAPTDKIMDDVKVNTNQSGTTFKTLREIASSYVLEPTTVTVQYNTNLGNLAIWSWDYINQFQPRQDAPVLEAFPLANIDEMREQLLEHRPFTDPFIVNKWTDGLVPYKLLNWENNVNYMLGSQEGLAVKTYQSDLFNNWLNTEWVDGISGITSRTAIDTSGGSFTIDQLMIAEKMFNYLNRVMVSGGTYDDWLDATYAIERYERCESPMYHGSLIKELVFQEVISNSQSESQPLGTLAGRGVLARKHKGGKTVIRVKEPSYIIGIISITPMDRDWETDIL